MNLPPKIEAVERQSHSGRTARIIFPFEDSYLTLREMEVLRLIANGLQNKQIASKLSISIKTIEKHRQAVYDFLHVNSAIGLARMSLRTGLITLEEWLAEDAGEKINSHGHPVSRHRITRDSRMPMTWNR